MSAGEREDGATVVGTIDLTPTWRGVLPILIACIESGTATGRASAMGELFRMADIADRAVARSKAEEGKA